MAESFSFTKERLQALPLPESGTRVAYLDSKVAGLQLRVTATGVKTFSVYRRIKGGRPERITLGRFPEMTIEQARKQASLVAVSISDGVSPAQAKRIIRAQNRKGAMPALDAWHHYVATQAPRWSESHLKDHYKVSTEGGLPRKRGYRPGESKTTKPGILRQLLKLPLDQIDATRVERWVSSEAPARPTHTRLAFGLLRAFLNWCSETPEFADLIQQNACSSKKTRKSIPKRSPKNDCLQREQLPIWFEEVNRISNPVVSTYLQALLLTGARRTELATVTWERVDFKWNSMLLRDKVEGERTIPLTPYVRGLLMKLKVINETPPPEYRILNGKRIKNDLTTWKPSEWVFSSPTAKSGYLQDPSNAHERIQAAGGLPNVTLHGLRRSFKTLSEWVEVPAGIVAQIMGHKPSALAEKHYTVRPLDLLRKWHTRLEAWILNEAGIQIPSIEIKQPRIRVAK